MDKIIARLIELESKLDGKADRDWCDQRFSRIDEDIRVICETMRDGFNAFGARFDKMDDRFDKMDDRMLRIEMLMEEWRSDCRVFVEGWKSNRVCLDDVVVRVESLERKAS